SGGIALTGNAALGDASTALIGLATSGGGVSEAATATIVTGPAGTLFSGSGIVGTVSLDGTANTIAALGSLAVGGAGNDFRLTDTGNLSVTGPLTATQDVTLAATGAVSVSPTGSIDAGRTLAVTSGSGGIALNAGAVVTGPVVTLDGKLGTIDLSGTVNASNTLALAG